MGGSGRDGLEAVADPPPVHRRIRRLEQRRPPPVSRCGLPGVSALLAQAGAAEAPDARVGVFVGNAWDPTEGRETP